MRFFQRLGYFTNRLAAVCVAGLVASPSLHAADHVVIMAISAYPSGALEGVKHDVKNALEMAQKLGYDTRTPTILKDQQLSAQGMREALAQLTQRVKVNDRVFFYYSGHGSSSLVGSQCTSSLVSHDEKLLTTEEIKTYFDQMKGKVQDAFIMLDACFSGGHAGLSRGQVLAKAWQPQPGERCDQPTNTAKAWQLPPLTRGSGRAEQNFTFIAAASERQVALDVPKRGGLATTSLLHCLNDGVPASSLATTQDLVACAQAKVNAEMPGFNKTYRTKWTAPTIEASGNVDRPLDIKTIAASTSHTTAQPPRAEQVKAALRRMAEHGANGNWAFQVMPSTTGVNLKQALQQRVVRFPYTSSQGGYGYVLYVGTDGKDMKQLFPEPGENNLMPPKGEFPPLSIDPPAGDNTYLFVLSQTPQQFEHIFPAQQGASTAATPAVATAVQCELLRGTKVQVVPAEGSLCRNSGRIKPAAAGGTLEGYAAQMLVVSGR